MTSQKKWRDDQLRYAAGARCLCGAGMAYAPDDPGDPNLPFKGPSYWDCSAIMKGEAVAADQPGAVKHEARLPFVFYSVKSEDQPSANGRTTRPEGAPPYGTPIGKAVVRAVKRARRRIGRAIEG